MDADTVKPVCFVLALAASFGAVGTPARAAEPLPEAEPAPAAEAGLSVALAFDFEVLTEDLHSQLVAALEAELERLAQEQGFERSERDAAEVTVEVRIWQPEPHALVIDSVIEAGGEVFGQQEGVVCMDCTPEAVASRSLTQMPAAIEKIRAAQPEAQPPPPAEAVEPVEAPPEPRRSVQLGAPGYVGIVAGGLGLGAAIAGSVFLHRGKVLDGDPGAAFLDYTDHRPLGAGLLGAGLGMMVVGNVLLAVDLSVLQPRRQREDRARVRVTGVGLLVDRGASLGVQGRF